MSKLYQIVYIVCKSGITSPKLPPIAVRYCCHVIHVTSILHCHRPKFWWRNTDYTDFWYNFDTVLYQFLETGTSDRCLICIVQNLRFSGFSLYPLSFFQHSPFNVYFMCSCTLHFVLMFQTTLKFVHNKTLLQYDYCSNMIVDYIWTFVKMNCKKLRV